MFCCTCFERKEGEEDPARKDFSSLERIMSARTESENHRQPIKSQICSTGNFLSAGNGLQGTDRRMTTTNEAEFDQKVGTLRDTFAEYPGGQLT
jgi:hypothetical protein